MSEQKLESEMESIRDEGRDLGRKQNPQRKVVNKIDPVCTPRGLNPDDAKVLFHPIDYIVFNGIKTGKMKDIILLDRERRHPDGRKLQRSIERVVESGNYEWQTVRIDDSGNIKCK